MTYDEFKEFLLRTLWRPGDAQLTVDLDVLIAAANARLTRDLKVPRMTVSSFEFTMTENEATLPSDFRRPLNIQDSVSLIPLKSTSIDNISSLQSRPLTSVAPFYTIVGRKIRVAGPVSETSPLVLLMDYQVRVPDFAVDDSTWLIDEGEYLDLYLTACLAETPFYLKNDARVALWGQAYADKLASVNADVVSLDWGAPLASAMPSGISPRRRGGGGIGGGGGGSGSGSGLSDGNKVDITVSGGGTVWTINASAVTLAKMANLGAYTLIGNATGVATAPQAIASSADVIEFLGSEDAAAMGAFLGVYDLSGSEALDLIVFGLQARTGDDRLLITATRPSAGYRMLLIDNSDTIVVGEPFLLDPGAVDDDFVYASPSQGPSISGLPDGANYLNIFMTSGVPDRRFVSPATADDIDDGTDEEKPLVAAFFREWIDAQSFGGITDGDKGDITVSGTGAVWTIDAGVVTLAKMANLNRYELIGRSTTGAGVPEAVATSANTYSLLGAANYAAMRTLLDLEVGTDFNAYSANLAAFSGLTLIADRLPYANGSGTLALATFTSFARTILDDADQATVRATLGLNYAWVSAPPSAGVITIDGSTGKRFYSSVTSAFTLAVSNIDDEGVIVHVYTDATPRAAAVSGTGVGTSNFGGGVTVPASKGAWFHIVKRSTETKVIFGGFDD